MMSESMMFETVHETGNPYPIESYVIVGAEFDKDGNCIKPGNRYTSQEWAAMKQREADDARWQRLFDKLEAIEARLATLESLPTG